MKMEKTSKLPKGPATSKSWAPGKENTNNPITSAPLTPAPHPDSRYATPLISTAPTPLIIGSATEAEQFNCSRGGSFIPRVERPKPPRHQSQDLDGKEPEIVKSKVIHSLVSESSSPSSFDSELSDDDIKKGELWLDLKERTDDIIIAHRCSARGHQPERRPAALPPPHHGDLARHRPEITQDRTADSLDQSGQVAGGSTNQQSPSESPCCGRNTTWVDNSPPNHKVISIKKEVDKANDNHILNSLSLTNQFVYLRGFNKFISKLNYQKDIVNCSKQWGESNNLKDLNTNPKRYNKTYNLNILIHTAQRKIALLLSQQLSLLLVVLLFAHLTLPHSSLLPGAVATTDLPFAPVPNTTHPSNPALSFLTEFSSYQTVDPSERPKESSSVSLVSKSRFLKPDPDTKAQVKDEHLAPVNHFSKEDIYSHPAYLSDSSYAFRGPKCPCGVRNVTATRPDPDRTFLFYLTPASINQLEILEIVQVSLNLTYYKNPKASAITKPHSVPSNGYNVHKDSQSGKKDNSSSRQERSVKVEQPTKTANSLHYKRESSLRTSKSLDRKRKSARNQQNYQSDQANQDEDEEEYFCVMVFSDDSDYALPFQLQINVHWGVDDAQVCTDPIGQYLLMAVTAGTQHNFSVEARSVGRVTMSVATVEVDGTSKLPEENSVYTVASTQFPMSTIRGDRPADMVFNSAAAAIAIVISFGIGACTEMDSLKRQLKNPVALIIGFCCQFIIMPLIAFGIAMALPLDKDIQFGLLTNACVPGGGLSHVAVIIAGGDTGLSLSINLIGVIAMLGTAPLWMFVLGQYFQHDSDNALSSRSIPLHKFELWLAAAFFSFAAGLIIKRIWPPVAENILMWLIKPFLLLAAILYITLGVYINMYVFELVNEYALLGAALLPFCGCVIGGVTATICRQSYTYVKTIALETSSLNCLIVMVALRYTLPQPNADLAAMIPIWIMFTIPGLFVGLAICTKIKDTLIHYWRNRNSSKEEIQGSCKAYSVSSSVVSPPGTTTLSAPLVVADVLDDDATVSTASNQKVTVL